MNGSTGIALRIILIGIVALVVADLMGLVDARIDTRVASLIAMTALLIWLGPGLLARYQGDGRAALMHLLIWGVIALAFAAAYFWLEPVLAARGFR